MLFHISEILEQNMQIYVAGVKSVKAIVMQDKNEREAELHQRTYCIVPHIVFFCKNTASYLREYLVFKAISLKKLSFSLKMVRQEK